MRKKGVLIDVLRPLVLMQIKTFTKFKFSHTRFQLADQDLNEPCSLDKLNYNSHNFQKLGIYENCNFSTGREHRFGRS